MLSALNLYAGPKALKHLQSNGLSPADIGVIPAAAGGPKGLILGQMDKFLFGEWLPRSTQPIDLMGASIGAWRMATACLDQPSRSFERFQDSYIGQHYEFPLNQKRPTPRVISRQFAQTLDSFFGEEVPQVLAHPRYRLHVVTSRGRHVLRRESRFGSPLGYLGAFASNVVHRRALGAWLERVIFSTNDAALPIHVTDLKTQQVGLNQDNFALALRASCSIPFVLQAVHDIPHEPKGAYWDGGITDYHMHFDYRASQGIVLYPHFQKSVIPGWLDKGLKWRHGATPFLDNMIVLAPNPEWIQTLPNGKLPDRTDFDTYARDFPARVKVWRQAVQASEQLADELAQWLDKPDLSRVQPL
jgi:hypothetical protein